MFLSVYWQGFSCKGVVEVNKLAQSKFDIYEVLFSKCYFLLQIFSGAQRASTVKMILVVILLA